MRILIGILTILFSFIAFLINLPGSISLSPILNYGLLQSAVIVQHSLLFLLGFFVIFFVFLRMDKTHRSQKNYLLPFLQTIATVIICFFFSFVLLLFIAWLQLNSVALLLHFKPEVLGITTNTTAIANTLKTQNHPPRLIATDNNAYKELQAIAEATTGNTNFYGSSILPIIPSFLVLQIQKSPANMLLLDDTLIVTRLHNPELQKISPIVGYLLVQQYFPLRTIRAYPTVTIMDQKAFTKYRTFDTAKKLEKIALDVNILQEHISSISATIDQETASISAQQELIKSMYAQRDYLLKTCKSQGNYINHKFVRTNTDDYCKNLAGDTDSIVDKANKTIDTINQKIQENKKQMDNFINFVKFFIAQEKLSEDSMQNIPYELGVFEPKNAIQIVFYDTNAHEIADYFETLTHEYLHFASFQENKQLSSAFFEEGLTEYFARQTIHDNFTLSTNLGYPVYVKIISQMMKSIPETEFADIYFTKDEAKLESTLNSVYGDDFYNNTYPLFQALQYTSKPQETLVITNEILKRIGGTSLKEKDLYSNSSSL